MALLRQPPGGAPVPLWGATPARGYAKAVVRPCPGPFGPGLFAHLPPGAPLRAACARGAFPGGCGAGRPPPLRGPGPALCALASLPGPGPALAAPPFPPLWPCIRSAAGFLFGRPCSAPPGLFRPAFPLASGAVFAGGGAAAGPASRLRARRLPALPPGAAAPRPLCAGGWAVLGLCGSARVGASAFSVRCARSVAFRVDAVLAAATLSVGFSLLPPRPCRPAGAPGERGARSAPFWGPPQGVRGRRKRRLVFDQAALFSYPFQRARPPCLT